MLKDLLKQMESVLGNQDMNKGWYTLDDNNNVVKSTMLESCMIRQDKKFIVKQEIIGEVKLSTVFMGLDHSMNSHNPPDDHKPIVFETMIFGGEHNDYQERCSTWDEALKMHQDAVDLVNGGKMSDNVPDLIREVADMMKKDGIIDDVDSFLKESFEQVETAFETHTKDEWLEIVKAGIDALGLGDTKDV